MGAHSVKTERSDDTGRIPTEELLRAAMIDSGNLENLPVHPDHLSHFDTGAAKVWGRALLDRAVRTGLQTAVAWYATAQASGLVLNRTNLVLLLGVVAASILLSVLTALVSTPALDDSWWFQVLERGVKTFAQSVLAGWGVMETADAFVGGFPTNFTTILSSAAVAAATSVIMSIVTTNVGEPGSVGLSGPG